MNHRNTPKLERGCVTIGWREHVGLPEFGIPIMQAKIDTGARTSALHAVEQTVFELDGMMWVDFAIPIHGRRKTKRVKAQLIEERSIKNTGGVPEQRLVVRTPLVLAGRRWLIEVSLADRENMEFDLILGRTAIRRRGLLVDPGRSYALGQPAAKLKV